MVSPMNVWAMDVVSHPEVHVILEMYAPERCRAGIHLYGPK